MFKDDFVWGVASSAYQIEGRDSSDGAGECIWDVFARNGGTADCQNGDIACDHAHRYKEDFALMKKFGIKAYRFSISWSRLIPNGTGYVNEKAVSLYRDMIKCMKDNGIEPYITMYHWELPQALQDKGGWQNEQIVEWFGEYAGVIAENFTDLAKYVITLNEPQCFVGIGHLSGNQAPGLKLPPEKVFMVAHNALKAHGMAVKKLREYARQPLQIGYAPTCGVAYPDSESAEDIEVARQVYFGFYQPIENWTWNVSWFLDPIVFGRYPQEGLDKFKEYLPEFSKEDMELISQPIDFIGQNIYNGYIVKMGADGNPEFVDRPLGYPKTATNWPVTPECIYWGVRFIAERYKMPLYLTENGMGCHDRVSTDDRVRDPNRIDFLDRYLSQVQRAYDEGYDLRGYFLWTFLDNFEWEKGYNERFGIVHVDFSTQKRLPKDSAYWYKRVIESNGGVLSVNNNGNALYELF